MRSPESSDLREPSLINPEAYIGKRFFGITVEQIAGLPDGTAIRPFFGFFKAGKAVIVDNGPTI